MIRNVFLVSAITFGSLGAASAAPPREGTLPLPRFVSIRSDEVNLRAGPGLQYPIEWVLVRKGLPVEVVEEHDGWRRVRTADGALGWVHQQMLTGRRTALVHGAEQPLLRRAADARPVARLEGGLLVQVKECRVRHCAVEVAGRGPSGWMPKDALWGVYPDEQFD